MDEFPLKGIPEELSARRTLTRGQRKWLARGGFVLAAALIWAPRATTILVVSLLTVVYVAVLAFRFGLFRRSLQGAGMISVDRVGACLIPETDLPRFSVLIPAYREPGMVERLMAAVDRIEYPRSRLQVILILEADDLETQAAALRTPGIAEVLVVPPGGPQTKPRALNYALARCTGDFITVYDAEDIPDPFQLRLAAAAFRELPSTVACLQARLDFHNAGQNIITEWFTLEYTIWFTQFLPGLVLSGSPIPLGGTSNHFRRSVLEELGGWDPHNVTEDAELGLRMHRLGYQVSLLNSTTLEEANSDFLNWAKQRSRWYKGYLQTWLVNLRRPRKAWRAFGPRGFLALNLFVGGTPVLALVNPVFWALTILWFVAQPAAIQAVFPAPLLHIGLASWLVGNFAFIYSFFATASRRDDVSLLKAALLAPLYFLMMSVAAYKAAIQLVFTPSYWEKTHHGLDLAPAVAEEQAS